MTSSRIITFFWEPDILECIYFITTNAYAIAFGMIGAVYKKPKINK